MVKVIKGMAFGITTYEYPECELWTPDPMADCTKYPHGRCKHPLTTCFDSDYSCEYLNQVGSEGEQICPYSLTNSLDHEKLLRDTVKKMKDQYNHAISDLRSIRDMYKKDITRLEKDKSDLLKNEKALKLKITEHENTIQSLKTQIANRVSRFSEII